MNNDKPVLPPAAGNRDNNGIRPSIHGARAVTMQGGAAQGSRPSIPKIDSGVGRPVPLPGGRPASPSQQISMRAGLGDNMSASRAPSVVFPRPSVSVPSVANLPSLPNALPPNPALSRQPAPVMASEAIDAKTRALLPEELGEFEEEDDEINISTKALLPEELEACGLPPEPEDLNLSEEPEIELETVASTLPVGMKIDDRYEIKGVLGVGGFATVYKAHHLTIDRDVALKVMDLKKGVDPNYSQRFFREAKIAAKIHHNNVVSIYDFGHVAETAQPYIAMEMLHGHDLSHELTEAGPLSPKRAFVLFRPVLEALGQGHRLGIVHKDLKPENLYLVDPRGQRELMKVLDFGVARINSSEVAKLTSAGQLLGTPRYLAPEYIKQQLVSPAIDVYQMALIISEALTGVPAVSGDPFHAMMLHCSGKLQIAEFLLEGRVGEVFRKAICIDPEMRFQDCDAFAAALDEIADCFASTTPLKGGAPQLTPDSRTSSKLTAMPFTPGTGGGNTGESVQISAPQKKKKSIVPFIIVILLLIVGAGAAGYLFMQKKAEQQAQREAQKAEDPKPDPSYAFHFISTPSKATVKLKGGSSILCETPCSHEFKASELPASIVISKEGHHHSDLELTELLYKNEKGKVTVDLIKQVEQITELEFTLKYTPENAVVTESASGKKVCLKSPCLYTFNVDKGYVELTFTAAGFKTKKLNLAKPLYDENKGTVEITLDKDIPKPAAKKPVAKPAEPAPKPEPAPAPKPEPAPAPPPAPKPEKKPEIMLL